jgi:hypothetical protein
MRRLAQFSQVANMDRFQIQKTQQRRKRRGFRI